jgi:hypothetical protein
MRDRLEILNEGLAGQTIGIDGRIIREGDPVGSARAQTQLYRVFNRSSFDNGGRFYGSFWQNMGDRHRISIIGQPTVEIDYAGMHIRLLYEEVGKATPGDPYDLEGWPRNQVKIALLIAINAPTHSKTVRAIADYFREQGLSGDLYCHAQAILKEIKAKHPDIAHAFGSDAGIRLMRRDSEIAERVMIEILQATGVIPLCVHDSFIAPANLEGELREAMEKAFPNGKPKVSVPCDTSIAVPCDTSHRFGDMFCLDPSKVYQKIDLQYGTDISVMDLGCAGWPGWVSPGSGARVMPVWRVRWT